MGLGERIKPKIQKAINKLPTNATVKRCALNEYNEPIEEIVICEVIGLYHDVGETTFTRENKGKVEKEKIPYLMLVFDEKTKNIKKGDFVYLKNMKYEIMDTGNVYKLDAYLDMRLRQVNYSAS